MIDTLLNSSIKVETDSFSLDIARAEMVEEMERRWYLIGLLSMSQLTAIQA